MASNRAIKIIHFKIFTINFNRSRGCDVTKSRKLKFSKNHDFKNSAVNCTLRLRLRRFLKRMALNVDGPFDRTVKAIIRVQADCYH